MLKQGALPVLVTAVAVVLVLFASAPASATFIRDTDISTLSQGFGNIPRLLTDQASGKVTSPEFACNSISGGALVQTCPSGNGDATFQPNGLINGTQGVDGTVSVNNKDTIVSLSALGITNATQIRLLYNPSEPGSEPETDIHDITLKFYNAAGAVVISVDGGCGLQANCTDTASDPLFFGDTGTNLGNGGVGFVLKLDATQANAINQACGANLVNCNRVTAEATISLTADGPDSFSLFNAGQVPEPATLVLLGVSLLGTAAWGRKRIQR